MKQQRTVYQMLIERFKTASPTYKKAVYIVLRSNRSYYGSLYTTQTAKPKGPGFVLSEFRYNGYWT